MVYGRTCKVIICFIFLFSVDLYAFGGRRSDPEPEPAPPPVSVEPADTQAYPTRIVTLGEFLDTPFMLPDGKTQIDMKKTLPELVVTEMAQTTDKIRSRGTVSPGNGSEIKDKFIFRGGLTSFEASAFSGSIKIGYRRGVGDIGAGIVGGDAKITFSVGSLEMDYHIIDTERQEVVAVGRGKAVLDNETINVTLDFAGIKTDADFVFRSPMTPLFRKAAHNAIEQIVNDPNTNFYMDWTNRVTAINFDLRKIFIGAGARDSLKSGNVFTVYDANDMRLGEAKVSDIQHEKSAASFKNDLEDRILKSVHVGDAVKIYYFNQ